MAEDHGDGVHLHRDFFLAEVGVESVLVHLEHVIFDLVRGGVPA